MGLTPLEGLIMGTRSGDLDPAIIEYLCNHENLTVSEMLNILNKKSGVLGMSGGISSDFRDIRLLWMTATKLQSRHWKHMHTE